MYLHTKYVIVFQRIFCSDSLLSGAKRTMNGNVNKKCARNKTRVQLLLNVLQRFRIEASGVYKKWLHFQIL